jgi:hypothetical protein
VLTKVWVNGLDVADGFPDPAGDGFAGSLRGVESPAIPTTQADRCAELIEQEGSLLTQV